MVGLGRRPVQPKAGGAPVTVYSLWIPGQPVPKGRPKFRAAGAFVQAYTPAATRKAETALARAWQAQYPALPPLSGPLELSVIAWMPVQKGASKKRLALIGAQGQWHTVKPDADNLLKLVQDALNGVAYTDDNCVCAVKCMKCYGLSPGLTLCLRALDETPNQYLDGLVQQKKEGTIP